MILLQKLAICEANWHLSQITSIGDRQARNPPRGEEHCGGFQAIASRQFAYAKDNPLMLRAAEPGVSAEEPIPDGEHSAIIAVGLLEYDGMMDAMHVDRHQDRLHPAFKPLG